MEDGDRPVDGIAALDTMVESGKNKERDAKIEAYGVSSNKTTQKVLRQGGNVQKNMDTYKAINDSGLEYNDKTKRVYNAKGDAGLKVLTSLKGVSKTADKIKKLDATVSNENDRAFYFVQTYGGDMAKTPASFTNDTDKYLWYSYKGLIDADGNGQLNKKEKANLLPVLKKKYGDAEGQKRYEHAKGWY